MGTSGPHVRTTRPGRQIGSRSGGPHNRANYQPAGCGPIPRAYRPPTRITAVSHHSQADRRPRMDHDTGPTEPTTTRLVTETVVPATLLTTNPNRRGRF